MSKKHRKDEPRRTPDDIVRACMEDPEFLDALDAKEVGILGEALARTYLENRGLDTLEQGYRCSEGEADLIMFDEGTDEVVLVEVKTRRCYSDRVSVFPEIAVDERKRCRYARIAARYVLDHFPVFSIRFDVIAVTLRPGFSASVEHLCGAYEWDSER
ncbi:YraN family protein [Collinsella tanakaei]|uniref:YraN family protein n=1 Tax=Collinsella tanakaei TaxID=626935 RepID=UPI0025A43D6A|nr:YraN family protein [Collinsella tanakaei]MDM8245106.1 YraN family protein [Collinsella tanakaei]